MEIIKYKFNGYEATVIRPDNPNGEWIWKTEFFFDFDDAETILVDMGYTRVYYKVSNMYGNYKSVRLLHNFYLDLIKRFDLNKKCYLFGFSRGGLYAFNYTITYPETVKKIYLDAPVMDLTTWPRKDISSKEYCEMLNSYCFNDETLLNFSDMPINNLDEFFRLGVPMLLIAGDCDEVVPFEKNAKKIIDYCAIKGISINKYIKKGGFHHPHSLKDVTPVINFILND